MTSGRLVQQGREGGRGMVAVTYIPRTTDHEPSPASSHGWEASTSGRVAVAPSTRVLFLTAQLDPQTQGLIGYLAGKGFHIESGRPTLERVGSEGPAAAVAIIDCTGVALSTCRALSQGRPWLQRIPVILLIDRKQIPLLSELVRAGVADFAIKPVAREELEARLLLRLSWGAPADHGQPATHRPIPGSEGPAPRALRPRAPGPLAAPLCLEIDDAARTVSLAGQPVSLTAKEFDLLALLASDPGRVFPVQDILAHLWPCCPRADAADVVQYAHRLRRKLHACDDQWEWLVNVRGFGYKLDCSRHSLFAVPTPGPGGLPAPPGADGDGPAPNPP